MHVSILTHHAETEEKQGEKPEQTNRQTGEDKERQIEQSDCRHAVTGPAVPRLKDLFADLKEEWR